jgi:hypothetical protein
VLQQNHHPSPSSEWLPKRKVYFGTARFTQGKSSRDNEPQPHTTKIPSNKLNLVLVSVGGAMPLPRVALRGKNVCPKTGCHTVVAQRNQNWNDFLGNKTTSNESNVEFGTLVSSLAAAIGFFGKFGNCGEGEHIAKRSCKVDQSRRRLDHDAETSSRDAFRTHTPYSPVVSVFVVEDKTKSWPLKHSNSLPILRSSR